MLVKILGAIDLTSALAFLLIIFGFDLNLRFLLFCAGLLFMKSLFLITGDVLSSIDMISSICLILSIFIILPSFMLWIPAFLLLSKGFVSFL